MGRIYRDNRSGRLYVDYNDHAGRRIRKPAKGCITDREAERYLHELEVTERDTARDIARGVYDGRTNHAAIAETLEAYLLHQIATKRYGTVVASRIALGDTIGYFQRPDGNPRSGTIWPPRRETGLEDARRMARRFVCGPLGVSFADELTPGKLGDWVAVRRGRCETRTLNLRIKALKACLNWAAKVGRIRSNPIAGVGPAGRPAEHQWRALTETEVEAMLGASPEPYKTVWLAFVSTGVRHGELVQLTWPDVSFRTNSIRVRQETCKTHRQRDIPMSQALRARLLMMKAESPNAQGAVFVNRDGRPWRNNLDKRFRVCCQTAGITSRVVREKGTWWLIYTDDEGCPAREPLAGATTRKQAEATRRERRGREDGKIVIHSLRHTFTTTLLRRNVNIKVVSELLGHTTIQQTLQTYAHVFPKDKEAAVCVLPFGRIESVNAGEDSQVLGTTGT
jgi:integrase